MQSNSQLNIAIVGANGNVGHELIKILQQTSNITIHAFARDLEKAMCMLQPPVTLRKFDFSVIDETAFQLINKVFWMNPGNNSYEKRWLESMKRNGVSHIVFLSSIYPKVFALRDSEIHITQSGIDYTILRPNTFMQNFNTYEKDSIIQRHAFYYPASMGKTSFIDVRDIAAAASNIILCNGNDHFNKVYTLTGSEALDYYQAAAIISAACGHHIKYIDTTQQPQFEPEDLKGDPISVKFFEGVRNNIYAPVTTDLAALLNTTPRTLKHYANDYWKTPS